MATTTNYSWTTPDDTDLVKDGAAAIRTLGSSIDTSLVNLLGGTTGQVLTKSSGTDLDFAFATPAAGGMTSLASGTLSSTAVDLTSISQSYTDLYLIVTGAYFNTTNSQCVFRFNSDSGANYNWYALLTSTTPISETDNTYSNTEITW
jgi:hypothetical protein